MPKKSGAHFLLLSSENGPEKFTKTQTNCRFEISEKRREESIDSNIDANGYLGKSGSKANVEGISNDQGSGLDNPLTNGSLNLEKV